MAKATIGEIATLVTAKTAPFSKGMKRAGGEAKKFGKTAKTSIAGTLKKTVRPAFDKLKSMLTSPAGLIASIATASLTIARMGRALGETAAKIDRFGKTASRLDIATDQLMALEFAGQQTGVSFAEIEKGLEKFNKRLGLAAQGSGQAAKMLKRLNIDAGEFINVPLTERLATIAGKIEGAGTAAEKAAIADKLFGRAGASSLLNLLQQGEKGIQKLTETAFGLGITLDTHVVKSIEATNDALNRMAQRSKGVWTQMTASAWPMLGEMVGDLERLMQKAEGRQQQKNLVERIKDLNRPIANLFPYGKLFESYDVRARAAQGQMRSAEPLESAAKYRGARPPRNTADAVQQQTQTMLDIERREQAQAARQLEMLRRMRRGEAPIVDYF